MKIIKKAIELKSELDTLRPIKEEDELRIMQKFRLDWNFHSNNLEGNSLTYGETKALLLFGITAQGKSLKDHFEVTGHNEAIDMVIEVVKQERPLSENFIREIHKLILKEPYEVDAITAEGKPTKKTVNVGVYKSTPNHVKTKTGEIFRFATPEETPALMNDLIEWFRKKIKSKDVNPILIASEFHYKYIRIHPFDDGNGRTARILMNFIFMQFGYPPVIIKIDDKENYFAVLKQADAGVIEPFFEYIANNLVHSLEIMIEGAKGESIEEPDDIDKEISLLDQKFKTVGKPINIEKSIESLLKLYDNSISDLISKFNEKCSLFDKFYIENSSSIIIQKHMYKVLPPFNQIKGEINEIKIRCHHRTLKQIGYEKYGFFSIVNIVFEKLKYKIIDSQDKVIFVKLYDEQLTKKEINEIVNSEIRRHKKRIEEIMEEIKTKK